MSLSQLAHWPEVISRFRRATWSRQSAVFWPRGYRRLRGPPQHRLLRACRHVSSSRVFASQDELRRASKPVVKSSERSRWQRPIGCTCFRWAKEASGIRYRPSGRFVPNAFWNSTLSTSFSRHGREWPCMAVGDLHGSCGVPTGFPYWMCRSAMQGSLARYALRNRRKSLSTSPAMSGWGHRLGYSLMALCGGQRVHWRLLQGRG